MSGNDRSRERSSYFDAMVSFRGLALSSSFCTVLRVTCELECLFQLIQTETDLPIALAVLCFFRSSITSIPSKSALLHHNGSITLCFVSQNERRYSLYPLLVREDLKQQ